jgi:hypothetical protein
MSTVEHPRPKGLLHNPAFSQVAVASGTRTIYTAGQVVVLCGEPNPRLSL